VPGCEDDGKEEGVIVVGGCGVDIQEALKVSFH
jgi:hypothetical protein